MPFCFRRLDARFLLRPVSADYNSGRSECRLRGCNPHLNEIVTSPLQMLC